jgi:hypothetical protein
MNYITTVTPAYGRDYATAAAACADWDSGKDFIRQEPGHCYDGKAINKADADRAYLTVQIRFSAMRKVCAV